MMIDDHSSKLRDIPFASTYYEKIRSTFDQIERHIQSLEALRQNVENKFLISLNLSKLPRTILSKLEDYKNSKLIWTVANFRKELQKYLSTQELGYRFTKLNRNMSDFEKKQEETSDFRRYQRYGSNNNNLSAASFTVIGTNKKIRVYCRNKH